MKRGRSKIILRGFRPGGRGASHVLGDLEAAVMEVLWRKPGQTVNEVEERMQQQRGGRAHTTVLTTLDRLYRKDYLTREKQGKAFVYAPRYSRAEFEHGVAQEVLGALLGQFTEPTISAFVDLIGDSNERLDRLEEMIREKRRASGNGRRS